MCLGTFVWAIACLALVSATSAEELRTWTNSTGKFKIEARLLGVEGEIAKLERKDGTVVQIPLTKLSAADRKYIEELEEANPFEPVEENPFQPINKSQPKMSRGPRDDDTFGEAKTVNVNWSRVESLPLMPSSDKWEFKTPIQPAEVSELRPRAISIPAKSNFFERTQNLAVNASGQRAVIGYSLDEPKPEGTTRLVLADLEKGKTLVTASTSGKMVPLALNDRGFQVLMRRDDWGFGKQDRLELWNLSPDGITKVLEWIPYDDQKGGERDLKWAAFLDDDHIATLGGCGKLAVWNVDTVSPLYYLQIDGGCAPALSPDRKLLAFSTGTQVGVLDLERKEVVALQTTGRTPWPKLRFSPDAKQLALLAHSKLLVYDFADGKLYREISLIGSNVAANELQWPHQKYLLLGKTSVFDIENQLDLWTYRGHDMVETIGDQSLFVVHDGWDKPGALVIAAIPAPGFEKALADAMKQPDFLVLKAGTTVKVNVDGLPDPAEREKVREVLTRKLKEQGFQVGSQGTIELVASSEAGEEKDVSYHGFGISPWKSYKVREYVSRLAFVYQGKNTWQTQGSSVPGHIQLKEGETIEQVLRRSERPNYAYFDYVELPKVLMKPMGPDGLGLTQVTTSGTR